MRTSSLALLIPLAACGGQDQQRARAEEERAEAAAPKFPCATGTRELRPECTAERARTDKGWIITLRHPDGHFRRVLVGDDNRVTAADGAETVHLTSGSAGVEIAIRNDRYLLPVQR